MFAIALPVSMEKLSDEQRKNLSKMSTSAIIRKLVTDASVLEADVSSLDRPALVDTLANWLASQQPGKTGAGESLVDVSEGGSKSATIGAEGGGPYVPARVWLLDLIMVLMMFYHPVLLCQ